MQPILATRAPQEKRTPPPKTPPSVHLRLDAPVYRPVRSWLRQDILEDGPLAEGVVVTLPSRREVLGDEVGLVVGFTEEYLEKAGPVPEGVLPPTRPPTVPAELRRRADERNA